jgi:hypothetical protein
MTTGVNTQASSHWIEGIDDDFFTGVVILLRCYGATSLIYYNYFLLEFEVIKIAVVLAN